MERPKPRKLTPEAIEDLKRIVESMLDDLEDFAAESDADEADFDFEDYDNELAETVITAMYGREAFEWINEKAK